MSPPRVDDDARSFWAGMREHRIVLQQCEACGRRRFPPMPSCPFCGGPGGTDTEVDGHGKVYSWVVVHRALTPAQEGEVPYTVATVELPDGVRMVGRLIGEGAPDAPVAPVFVDHDDWTELRFEVLS
jgi:uncharacterized OB-fold protein